MRLHLVNRQRKTWRKSIRYPKENTDEFSQHGCLWLEQVRGNYVIRHEPKEWDYWFQPHSLCGSHSISYIFGSIQRLWCWRYSEIMKVFWVDSGEKTQYRLKVKVDMWYIGTLTDRSSKLAEVLGGIIWIFFVRKKQSGK